MPAAIRSSRDRLYMFIAVFVTLVEKFDTEFNSDFSAKSPNFRGLVIVVIEANLCN